MGRQKNPTSVTFRKEIEQIKDQLVGVYGLANAVSAGLTLLSRLSDADQKKLILEIKGKPSEKLVVYTDSHIKGIIEETVKSIAPVMGTKPSMTELEKAIAVIKSTVLHIPGRQEADQLSLLRKIIGPEPKHKKEAG